ncbi:hypothetical protein ACU686_09315 [Yinghuangia aomiensis]
MYRRLPRGRGRGAAALLVGREEFVLERRLTSATSRRASLLLGAPALRAESWTEYRNSLPNPAKAALEGILAPSDLLEGRSPVVERRRKSGARPPPFGPPRHGRRGGRGGPVVRGPHAEPVAHSARLSADGGRRPEVLDAPV